MGPCRTNVVKTLTAIHVHKLEKNCQKSNKSAGGAKIDNVHTLHVLKLSA